jgi:hypothetical protein
VADDERAGEGDAVAAKGHPEDAAGEDEGAPRLPGRCGGEDSAERGGQQQEATA